MQFLIENYIWLFTGCLICILITGLLMARQAKRFYTMGRIRQSFGILDLQFASTPEELVKLITGIDQLQNAEEARVSKKALKTHLYIDFLFMPAMYLFIALLCFVTAMKMEQAGQIFFAFLAFLQAVPFIFDISENLFLLNKINKPVISSDSAHKFFRRIIFAKWLIASFSAIAAISALSYFWVTGKFYFL